MKILFDYEIFYLQKYGGISNYFCNLGLELIKKNYSISYLSPIHKNNNLKKIPKNNIYGMRLIYPKFFNFFVDKINFNLSNLIINKKKPDLIHKTYFSKNNFSFALKKFITFYDVTHELSRSKSPYLDQIIKLKKNNMSSAHHILVPSNTVKSDLINFYNIKENKISVTYFSSDYEKISKEDLCLNKKLKNYLLYVGNRSGYKNFKSLVKAYSHSERLKKDFKIIVFGGEKPNISGRELFKNENLASDSFKFVYGSNEYLKYLYKNVAALIYTSTYEGFGIPLIEAMRSGCPIITSNGGALKEIGGEGMNFFDPHKIEDLKIKLEDTVYSKSRTDELIQYGLKRCDLFSWTKCANQTLDAYKKV